MSSHAVLASVEDWQLSRWMVSYAVNALWQAPMVAAAAWAVSRMMRRAGPRAEHMLWVGALLVMVALPAVPRVHLPHHEAATVTMGADDYDLSLLPPLVPAAQPWWVPEIGLATLPRGLVMSILLFYFGAGLYFALRLGWSLWRTAMLVREAAEAEFAPESEAVWQRCRDAFALDEVQRLVSCDIACPVTVGRATVLVPAGFVESAAAEELLTAMAHECAHLRRRDFWKNVAYELASLPVAFHPMLWMVKRQIAETREMVCDGAAVERLVTPQSYVRSLLRLAEGVVGPSMGLAAMGMFDGRTLERRIVSMKMRRGKMSTARRAGILCAAAIAGIAVIAGGALLAVAVEAKAVPASQQVSESAGQQVSESASQQVSESASQQVSESASQQVSESASQQTVADSLQHGQLALEQKNLLRQQMKLKQDLQNLSDSREALKQAGSSADTLTTERQQQVDQMNLLAQDLKQRQLELKKRSVAANLRLDELKQRLQQNELLYGQAGKDYEPLLKEYGAAGKDYQAKAEAARSGVQELMKQLQQNALLYGHSNKEYGPTSKEFAATSKEFQAKVDALRSQLAEQQRYMAENRTFQPFLKGGVSAKSEASAALGSVKGRVMEQSGKAVAGALVTASNLATRVQTSVATDGNGEYALSSLPGGAYGLIVKLNNAVRWSGGPMVLGANAQPVRIDMKLQPKMYWAAAPRRFSVPDGVTAPVAAQNVAGPQRISGGVIAGSKLSGDEPQYPPIARAAHVSGTVVLHAIISETGAVEDLSVIAGPAMLQNAALEAVRTWRYKPYMLKNKPTRVETTITVNFTVNDGKPQATATGPAAAVAVPVPSGPGPQRVSAGVMAGAKLSGDEPGYPPIARAAHVSGAVVLHAIISKTGAVEDLNVITGPQMLQNAALRAVRTWRYKPFMLGDNPTEVETTITVNFMLGDGKPQTPAAPQGASTESAPRDTIYRIGGDVAAPRVLRTVEPEFSEEAKKAMKEKDFHNANVQVGLVVDAQGLPQRIRVMKPVGMGLDEQAVKAVKQYLFSPALRQGHPVPVALSIEVDFQQL